MKPVIQSLNELKTGQTGTVAAFRGDYKSRERLASMGITIGSDVQVLMNHSGRCLVAIHDTRIAVSHEAVQDILIAVKEPEDAFSQAVSRLKQIWAR